MKACVIVEEEVSGLSHLVARIAVAHVASETNLRLVSRTSLFVTNISMLVLYHKTTISQRMNPLNRRTQRYLSPESFEFLVVLVEVCRLEELFKGSHFFIA